MFSDLTADSGSDNFIVAFQINVKESTSQMIALTYFAFTSLSTVGLGDMHPISNHERMVGSFLLLVGVTVTTFIMENLTSMLKIIQRPDKVFD